MSHQITWDRRLLISLLAFTKIRKPGLNALGASVVSALEKVLVLFHARISEQSPRGNEMARRTAEAAQGGGRLRMVPAAIGANELPPRSHLQETGTRSSRLTGSHCSHASRRRTRTAENQGPTRLSRAVCCRPQRPCPAPNRQSRNSVFVVLKLLPHSQYNVLLRVGTWRHRGESTRLSRSALLNNKQTKMERNKLLIGALEKPESNKSSSNRPKFALGLRWFCSQAAFPFLSLHLRAFCWSPNQRLSTEMATRRRRSPAT